MRRFVAVLIMIFTLAACASSPIDDAVSKLEPGMSKDKVLVLLGQPADRSFRGVDEALQYQEIAGLGQCKYTTVWLSEGKLVGVTTRRGGSVLGCGLGSQPVDWQQMPSAQQK